MKVFLTEVNGQFVYAVVKKLTEHGHCVTKNDVTEEYKWTLKKLSQSMQVGHGILICEKFDCKIVCISTDYVFNGQGEEMWQPDWDKNDSLNVYGQTKFESELAVREILTKYYIVRIAWGFVRNGKNFIKTMLSAEKNMILWAW